MAKYNRPNGRVFGSSATNIGKFGSGQDNNPQYASNPNDATGDGTHWEDGWNGAVVSQAPYTAPYVEDMNAVNYVNSYNSAYLLQRGIAEYSATEEYQKDSLCTYNGEIWMCKLDNTVGQTPAEGIYWHLQGEVPIMNDNEILVGAVGGTPTVVDTNNQGDVLASASGLDIKANTIVNADVNSSAGIVESKLSLDYATATLNTNIGTVSNDLTTHTSNTSNPHSVTKAQVLSGNLIVNADVDASAGIEESKLALDYSTSGLNTAITTHTGDVANPHSTKIANLGDVTLTTPINDGDVIKYDLVSQKFVNSAPLGGALSTLSDVTLTSPTDKQLVQYDYANSKWVNSSEVWNTIEVYDIANINTAVTDVTLTKDDKRHQIFTATDGFNITLPSTGIKAGEKVILEFTQDGAFTSNSMKVYVGSTFFEYAHIGNFSYIYTALVDNPSLTTDWMSQFRLRKPVVKYKLSGTNASCPQNTRTLMATSTLVTLFAGIWDIHYSMSTTAAGGIGDTNPWTSYLVISDTSPYTVLYDRASNDIIGFGVSVVIPRNRSISISDTGTDSYSSWQATNFSKTAMINVLRRSENIKAQNSVYNTSAAATCYFTNNIFCNLVEPVRVTNITG